MSSAATEKKYVIEVFQYVDGTWLKHEDRGYATDFEDKAVKYCNDVNGCPGWKAVLNGEEPDILPDEIARFPALHAALETNNHTKVREAMEQVASQADSRALQALIALLAWRSLPKGLIGMPSLRERIVEAIGKHCNPAALESLERALTHDDEMVRRAAATALAGQGAAAIPIFVKSLRDKSNIVRSKALHQLKQLGWTATTPAERVLVAVTERNWTAMAGEESASEEILIEALQFDDSVASYGDRRGETYYDEEANWPTCKSCIAEQAVKCLATIGTEKSIEPLLKLMQSGNTDLRREAVLALQKLGINPDE